MTTTYEKSVTCAICNHNQMVTGIATTNSFGSPDLDTRPPEMKRSTIDKWVQRCESCGYCAANIEIKNPKAASIVNSPEYQEQLRSLQYPYLANYFLCKAIIDKGSDNFAAATWSLLHAAWVCDDSGKEKQAILCRHSAVETAMLAESYQQPLMSHQNEQALLLMDLLRRSGQFEQARQVIDSKRSTMLGENFLLQILDFQHVLVDARDPAPYTINDAFDKNEET